MKAEASQAKKRLSPVERLEQAIDANRKQLATVRSEIEASEVALQSATLNGDARDEALARLPRQRETLAELERLDGKLHVDLEAARRVADDEAFREQIAKAREKAERWLAAIAQLQSSAKSFADSYGEALQAGERFRTSLPQGVGPSDLPSLLFYPLRFQDYTRVYLFALTEGAFGGPGPRSPFELRKDPLFELVERAKETIERAIRLQKGGTDE